MTAGCASSIPSSSMTGPEVSQELIERLLAVPGIEDLELPIFTQARMEPHGTFGCSSLAETVCP